MSIALRRVSGISFGVKNSTPATIGGRVRMARNARKLTQEDVAGAVGIDQSTLSNLERDRGKGEYEAATILGIARTLGVSPYYLFYGDAAPIDDVAAAAELCQALGPRERAAWMAAGRAMLEPPAPGGSSPSAGGPRPTRQ